MIMWWIGFCAITGLTQQWMIEAQPADRARPRPAPLGAHSNRRRFQPEEED